MPDGLDMSHEDIQRTLQANMPLKAHNGHPPPPPHQPHPAHPAHAHPHPHPVDLNPMDFIEHDVVAPPPPTHPHPPPAQSAAEHSRNFDMSLDAFDVFGDFSDLQQQQENNYHHHQQQPHLNKMKRGDAAAEHHLAQITEYSPDWAWSDVSERRPKDLLRLVKVVSKKDSTTSISIIICCFNKFPLPRRVFCSFLYHTHQFHSLQIAFQKVPPISRNSPVSHCVQ